MKFEPLTKEKMFDLRDECESWWDLKDWNFFLKEDVKSAVQWLLKEIEKIQNSIEDPDLYGEGLFDGLTIAKEKVKKAFEGVEE